MRILHLIHSEGVYGAELILLYLAREQQQRGHEALVGSIRDPRTEQTPFEALAQSWGLPVVGIRIASRPTPPVVRSLPRTVHEVANAHYAQRPGLCQRLDWGLLSEIGRA